MRKIDTAEWTVYGAATVLGGLAQFFAATASPAFAVGTALLLAPASVCLGKFFGAVPRIWAPGLASLAGVSLAFGAARREPLLWVCPVVALALMAGISAWRERDARRCELCNGRLAGAISFTCPRCGLPVCEARCWDFERVRCRLCVQNRVPALPIEAEWWERNIGPQARRGRCQLCQSSAEEADLRSCPKCGRPQCRECWDDANGSCSRCGWSCPALPDGLKQFV